METRSVAWATKAGMGRLELPCARIAYCPIDAPCFGGLAARCLGNSTCGMQRLHMRLSKWATLSATWQSVVS